MGLKSADLHINLGPLTYLKLKKNFFYPYKSLATKYIYM